MTLCKHRVVGAKKKTTLIRWVQKRGTCKWNPFYGYDFLNGMECKNHLLALLDGAWMIRHEAGVVVHLLLHGPHHLLLDRLDRLAGDGADLGIFRPLLLVSYNCP